MLIQQAEHVNENSQTILTLIIFITGSRDSQSITNIDVHQRVFFCFDCYRVGDRAYLYMITFTVWNYCSLASRINEPNYPKEWAISLTPGKTGGTGKFSLRLFCSQDSALHPCREYFGISFSSQAVSPVSAWIFHHKVVKVRTTTGIRNPRDQN